jgi:membrane associated rhomboid family serine protease
MGAYLVLYPHSRVLTIVTLVFFWEIVEVPAIFLLGFWFVMQLFSAGAIAVTANSQGGGVAFAAHVAGFIAGAVGVLLFRKRELTDSRWRQ